MGIYFNPGNEGFKSALRSKIYIDKTGLLEYTNSVLDTEQSHLVVIEELRKAFPNSVEEAKRWYDGYHLAKDLHIYNPKSVVDSVRRKKIGNYWTSTETYESLKYYISMNFDGLKDAIIEMLAGGRCNFRF